MLQSFLSKYLSTFYYAQAELDLCCEREGLKVFNEIIKNMMEVILIENLIRIFSTLIKLVYGFAELKVIYPHSQQLNDTTRNDKFP